LKKKVILAAKFAGLDIDIAKESDAYMPGTTLTNLILVGCVGRYEGSNTVRHAIKVDG
jgi:hypothetical protein